MKRRNIEKNKKINEIHISDESKSNISKFIKQHYLSKNLIRSSENVFKYLEKEIELTKLYKEFRQDDGNLLYIHNLPVHDINYSGQLTVGLSKYLGLPFQYKEQNNGELNALITPKPEFQGAINTGEGNGEFGFHSDDSFLSIDLRTTYIQLFGLINETNTSTRVAFLTDILNELSANDIKLLSEPKFKFLVPHSFKVKNEDMPDVVKPILTLDDGEYNICYASYNCSPVEGSSKDYFNAMHRLNFITDLVAIDVVLKPGELLVFNNNKVLHGRGEIVGGKRAILRTLIKKDINNLDRVCSSDDNIYSIKDLV